MTQKWEKPHLIFSLQLLWLLGIIYSSNDEVSSTFGKERSRSECCLSSQPFSTHLIWCFLCVVWFGLVSFAFKLKQNWIELNQTKCRVWSGLFSVFSRLLFFLTFQVERLQGTKAQTILCNVRTCSVLVLVHNVNVNIVTTALLCCTFYYVLSLSCIPAIVRAIVWEYWELSHKIACTAWVFRCMHVWIWIWGFELKIECKAIWFS